MLQWERVRKERKKNKKLLAAGFIMLKNKMCCSEVNYVPTLIMRSKPYTSERLNYSLVSVYCCSMFYSGLCMSAYPKRM